MVPVGCWLIFWQKLYLHFWWHRICICVQQASNIGECHKISLISIFKSCISARYVSWWVLLAVNDAFHSAYRRRQELNVGFNSQWEGVGGDTYQASRNGDYITSWKCTWQPQYDAHTPHCTLSCVRGWTDCTSSPANNSKACCTHGHVNGSQVDWSLSPRLLIPPPCGPGDRDSNNSSRSVVISHNLLQRLHRLTHNISTHWLRSITDGDAISSNIDSSSLLNHHDNYTRTTAEFSTKQLRSYPWGQKLGFLSLS